MQRCFPLLYTFLLAAAPFAQAITIRDDVGSSGAVTLGASLLYASVGKLNRSGDITSGVLIAPQFLLTARHVVVGDEPPGPGAPDDVFRATSSFIFTIGGTDYTSAGYTKSGVDDLAIIQLTTPVVGVTPAVLYTGSSEVGQEATMVGFGEGGLGTTGADGVRGTKRAATNLISSTSDPLLSTTGRWLFSDFDSGNPFDSYFSPDTMTANEGLIAPGDSGGGTFATISSVSYLIGIHSSVWMDGDAFSFNYGDVGGDVRVSTAMPFIQSVVPEPSSIACLALGLAVLGARRKR